MDTTIINTNNADQAQYEKDYIAENLLEEELDFEKKLKKKKQALMGLGSLYFLLLLFSFVFLV